MPRRLVVKPLRTPSPLTLAEPASRIGAGVRRLLSGVATPAEAPTIHARAAGRWEEGSWGLGPLAQRRFRLYLPPGATRARPVPVLLLLHGCGQDSASFAASTRAARLAQREQFAVLMPEQTQQANAQRCWNWFRSEAQVATECLLLLSIVEHACLRWPLRRDRLYALGLSAGGAMALTLGLRHPERFVAVGSHSGAVPASASNPLQAAAAMQGRRLPDVKSLRLRLFGRRPPPMIVLHGDADRIVAPACAQASATLWLELLPAGTALKSRGRELQRGERLGMHVTDWQHADGSPYVRAVRVHELGHAWSGGAADQAFSEPAGPDALTLAWRFFDAAAEAHGRR